MYGNPSLDLITAIKEVLSRRALNIDTPCAAMPPSLSLSLPYKYLTVRGYRSTPPTGGRFCRCPLTAADRPWKIARSISLETPSSRAVSLLPLSIPCPPSSSRSRYEARFPRGERVAGRRAFGPLPRRVAISRGEGSKNLGPLSLSLPFLCSVGHRESSRSEDLRSSTRERPSSLSHPRLLLPGRRRGQERRLNRVWPTSRTRITEELGRPVADHYPKTTFVSFAGGRSRYVYTTLV